jgi:hypothetical protein
MFPTIYMRGSGIFTPDTYMSFWVDSSGSLGASTISALNSMLTNYLQPALIQYYNDDPALFASRVTFRETSEMIGTEVTPTAGTENTLFALANGGLGFVEGSQHIVIVYQDEASAYNAGNEVGTFDPNAARTAAYDADLAYLKANVPANWIGIVLHIYTSFGGNSMWQWLDAIKAGDGQYSGANGFSEDDRFSYVKNLTDGTNQVYFYDQTIAALQAAGFDVG